MEVRVIDLLFENKADGDFEFFDDLFESDEFLCDFFDLPFLFIDLNELFDIECPFNLNVGMQ